jgi:rod shape-determining protein MreC
MVGLLAIQTSSAVSDGVDAGRRAVDGAVAATAELTAGPRGGFALPFGSSAEDRAEIERLRAEVRRLERFEHVAQAMALRMAEYERILDVMGEPEGGEVTARVVAEMDGPFSASRLANAGFAQGVADGFAAVNEKGLVGRVVRTGEHTSRILLVTDYNSRIPVMGAISQDRALLVGDRGEGARLREAETPDRIVEGEMWVTSGDDGQAPGVRVGRARRDGADWRIDLAMHEAPLDYVRLVPPPAFPAPEDETPAAGDAVAAAAGSPAP